MGCHRADGTSHTATCGCAIGTQRGDLYIGGEHLHGIDEGAILHQTGHADDGLVTLRETTDIVLLHKQIGDIHQLITRHGVFADDIKLHKDGVHRRAFHEQGHLIILVGHLRLQVVAHEEGLVVTTLKIDHVVIDLLTRQFGKSLWDIDKTGDHKEHAVQHLLREFEIPLTIDMANGKDALLHGAALLEQFLVGIFLGCT